LERREHMRVSKKRPPSLTRFKALNCYAKSFS
jgi:hypothetical protein